MSERPAKNSERIGGADVPIFCTWPARAKTKRKGPLCYGFAGRVWVPNGMMAKVVDHVAHSQEARPGLLVTICAICGRMNAVGFEKMEKAG